MARAVTLATSGEEAVRAGGDAVGEFASHGSAAELPTRGAATGEARQDGRLSRPAGSDGGDEYLRVLMLASWSVCERRSWSRVDSCLRWRELCWVCIATQLLAIAVEATVHAWLSAGHLQPVQLDGLLLLLALHHRPLQILHLI